MDWPASQHDWQQTVDRDFPRGLLMEWVDDPDTTYRIPHIDVVDISDNQPVVRLDAYDAHKGFVFQITAYTVITRDPVLAYVSAQAVFTPMIWRADIPDQLAEQMAASRRDDW